MTIITPNTVCESSGSLLRPRGVQTIQVGPLSIDPLSREVRVDGTLVYLNRREYSVLRVLAADPTRVFTREEMYDRVYGSSYYSSRTLDSQASRLRQKLAVHGGRFVFAIWGVGYRLVEAEAEAPIRQACCPTCGQPTGEVA